MCNSGQNTSTKHIDMPPKIDAEQEGGKKTEKSQQKKRPSGRRGGTGHPRHRRAAAPTFLLPLWMCALLGAARRTPTIGFVAAAAARSPRASRFGRRASAASFCGVGGVAGHPEPLAHPRGQLWRSLRAAGAGGGKGGGGSASLPCAAGRRIQGIAPPGLSAGSTYAVGSESAAPKRKGRGEGDVPAPPEARTGQTRSSPPGRDSSSLRNGWGEARAQLRARNGEEEEKGEEKRRRLSVAPRKLIVVRHGETEWNRELRVQGSTDVALNARGLAQAQRCAEVLARECGSVAAPDKIFTSQLARASVTASAIADALTATASGFNCVTTVHEQLNEWNLGLIEGMRKEEAAEKHPSCWEIFSQWSSHDVSKSVAAQPIRGGESMEDVRQRVVEIVEEACEQVQPNDCPIIVVTHGGVLGQLLRHVYEQGRMDDATLAECSSCRPTNGCISRFSVIPGGYWDIISWVETEHLSGDVAPVSANYNLRSSGE